MSKKVIVSFISGILMLAVLQFYPIYKKYKDSKALQDHVSSLVQEGVLLNESLAVKDVLIHNGEIIFHLNVHPKFEEISKEMQFGYLEYLAKNIRYTLRNGEIASNTYQHLGINIICKSQSNTYEYKNVLKNKKQPVFSQGTLYVNDEEAVTTPQFKTYLLNHQPTDQANSFEKEVFNYAVNLFKQLTVGGKYFNYERDSKIIVDIVTKKFDITYKQYSEIYQKQFITSYAYLYNE